MAKIHQKAPMSCIMGLGIIGAAIHFIGAATTFRGGVLGFLKALVWPVFVVMGLLEHLAM